MSLKQEIQTWVDACDQYDKNDYATALQVFDGIADQSKILFNMGVIHATIGEHDRAVECYAAAIRLDQYMAIAYFQQGVSNFLVGDFEEALANFNDTLLYMRGNTHIDYEQLGLKFRLYSCEILFNRGLCYIYLQQEGPGMEDMGWAQKEKMTPDHEVIDEAIREKAMGYTVFSIPVGIIYRPNEAKVKNLAAKNYLGKAQLIATANANNLGTGFAGAEQKARNALEASAKDDRPSEQISYAATNLVDRSISSRRPAREPMRPSREASAPPLMQRSQYPPTPPPENEKSFSRNSGENRPLPVRTTSMRNYAQDRRKPPDSAGHPDDPVRPTMPSRQQTFDVNPNRQPAFLASQEPTQRERSWPEQPPVQSRSRGPPRTESEPRRTASRRDKNEQLVPAPLYRELTPRSMEERTVNRIIESYDRQGTDDEAFQRQQSRSMRSDSRMKKMRSFELLDEEGSDIENEPSSSQENLPSPPRHRSREQSLSSARNSARAPEMTQIRVKAHFNDEIRFIMLGAFIDFGDFESKVREKFSIRNVLKIKIRDESGDMVTLGDQEDLEAALTSVRKVARKERAALGKMTIWVA